jgi:hypothetical protein
MPGSAAQWAAEGERYGYVRISHTARSALKAPMRSTTMGRPNHHAGTNVHQPADPRPVGRRPEHVARLRVELEDRLQRRDMAEDEAMGVQRALGIARGAGGVDENTPGPRRPS